MRSTVNFCHLILKYVATWKSYYPVLYAYYENNTVVQMPSYSCYEVTKAAPVLFLGLYKIGNLLLLLFITNTVYVSLHVLLLHLCSSSIRCV
jgi:hypothetical protein